MVETKDSHLQFHTPSRRRVVAGIAMAFGSLAAGSELWAKTPQQMQEAPSTAANRTRTFLHQEVDFKSTPQRIYEILLDSKQFAAFTGMPAEIDPKGAAPSPRSEDWSLDEISNSSPTNESFRRGDPHIGIRVFILSSNLN